MASYVSPPTSGQIAMSQLNQAVGRSSTAQIALSNMYATSTFHFTPDQLIGIYDSPGGTYFRISYSQTATGANGSGTITTVISSQAGINQFGAILEPAAPPGTSGPRYTSVGANGALTRVVAGAPATGYLYRGAIAINNNYGSWVNNTDKGGTVLNSNRKQFDYYRVYKRNAAALPSSGQIDLGTFRDFNNGTASA